MRQYSQYPKQMGVGIVIRYHSGTCLSACSKHINGITVREMVEALAIWQALLFASFEGFDKMVLESYCLSMVQRVKSSEHDQSIFCLVTEDIK